MSEIMEGGWKSKSEGVFKQTNK